MSTDRLFMTSPAIDGRDEIEDYWLKNRDYVLSIPQLKNANQIDDDSTNLIVQHAHKSKHDEIQIGICCIYLFNSESETAPAWFNCLMMASRDNLQHIVNKIQDMLIHKYLKISKVVKNGILRLLNEMARASLPSHAIINILLRQIIGGEHGPDNIHLVESLLDICIEHRAWLEKNQECLQSVFFRYLRLIQDHWNTAAKAVQPTLIQKEIQFCVTTFRSNFGLVLQIGRDVIRLLLSLVHIPEFNQIWSDLINNPAIFQPNFTGIKEFMKIRTSKKFISLCVTFDMDIKINFMLLKIRAGLQSPYERWFTKMYLTSMGSVTLRADLIRFVCTCIIPTNEIIQSDILPRWMFCGWLLGGHTNATSMATSRLALIFDWLLFNESRNTIMDIEPCILMMHHYRRNNPTLTHTLLECILRTIKEFHLPMVEDIRRGVINAFRFILKLRVVSTIAPIICEKQGMPVSLQKLIDEYLVEFMPKDKRPIAPPADPRADPRVEAQTRPPSVPPPNRDTSEGTFSDDDTDGPPKSFTRSKSVSDLSQTGNGSTTPNQLESVGSSPPKRDQEWIQNRYRAILEKINAEKNRVDNFEEELAQLKGFDEEVANQVETIYNISREDNSVENDEYYHQLDSLFKNIQVMEPDQFESDMSQALGKCLAKVFRPSYTLVDRPTEKTSNEELEEMTSRPLYVLFRFLCEGSLKATQSLTNLLNLTASLQTADERTSYHLLYFIAMDIVKNHKCNNKEDNKWMVFDQFCNEFATDDRDTEHTEIQLLMSLSTMKDHDPDLLIFLVPFLYREFPKILINNQEVISSIISCINPRGVYYLQPRLRNGEFKMFQNNQSWSTLKKVIKASLEWESFEQTAFWTLLSSHRGIKIENWIQVFPYIDSESHPEALSAIWTMLGNAEPTNNIVKMLFARDQDEIVVSTLSNWLRKRKDMTKLADAMVFVMTTAKPKAPRKSSRQSGRSSGNITAPTIKQVLTHLNALRQNGDKIKFGFYTPEEEQLEELKEIRDKLFTNDSILAALCQMRESADADERVEFTELFNLFNISEDDEDDKEVEEQPKRKEKKRKAGRKAKNGNELIESDDSEEEASQVPKKKRL